MRSAINSGGAISNVSIGMATRRVHSVKPSLEALLCCALTIEDDVGN